MKNRRKRQTLLQRIGHSYAMIPKRIHSPHVRERSKAQKLIAATVCIPVILLCTGYAAVYKINADRIAADNAAYAALYETPEPVATVTPCITESPTPTPTASPTPFATPTSTPTATPSPVPVTPSPSPEPSPEQEFAADTTVVPAGTPDNDTLIFALETPGPIQTSFEALLEKNPETIGFLTVGKEIALPVVQRVHDNDFYLTHDFDGNNRSSGTLFLDGANLLVPEDQCLLIYGHNMKNGTMFNSLSRFTDLKYLRQNPVIYFDTIYKNGTFVPFAVFSASMDSDNKSYLNIRQFIFNETEHELFVLKMQKLSRVDIPIDVHYDDPILLLVTCEYTHDNGRLIVACRGLRSDETPDMIQAVMADAKLS